MPQLLPSELPKQTKMSKCSGSTPKSNIFVLGKNLKFRLRL